MTRLLKILIYYKIHYAISTFVFGKANFVDINEHDKYLFSNFWWKTFLRTLQYYNRLSIRIVKSKNLLFLLKGNNKHEYFLFLFLVNFSRKHYKLFSQRKRRKTKVWGERLEVSSKPLAFEAPIASFCNHQSVGPSFWMFVQVGPNKWELELWGRNTTKESAEKVKKDVTSWGWVMWSFLTSLTR